jgi:AcrR family transcriptional regulator
MLRADRAGPSLDSMRRTGQGRSYHHGDLRAALIDTALEIIGERGVRNFSLAEASRRLGVAVSAPYAHFADRDALLAAVTAHALDAFAAELLPGLEDIEDPARRLAVMARRYVRFAAARRALFEVVYQTGLDKASYPEIEAARRPLDEAFDVSVAALTDNTDEADDLGMAIEATAHGHAALLLDSHFGPGQERVEEAADRAERATLALVSGRQALRGAALDGSADGGR